MAKYQQTTGSAATETWQRASQIILWNEPTPRVEIHHERKTQYSDGLAVTEYLGQLSHSMTDPSLEIPLIDPATYTQTETTFTAGEFATMAASIYIWLSEQANPPE